MSIRVFLSSVTQKMNPPAPKGDPLRTWLADDLKKAGTTCVYQEFLIEEGVNTLSKLSNAIRVESEVVIHVLGADPGSVPPIAVINEFLRDLGGKFQKRFPELFEGDVWKRLSYTQWEAWLALFHRKGGCRCFCIHEGMDAVGKANAEGVIPLSNSEHARWLKPHAGYFTKVSGPLELTSEFKTAMLRKFQTGEFDFFASPALHNRFGEHTVDELKFILCNSCDELLAERFVLFAYAHICDSLPAKVAHASVYINDVDLVDQLAELRSPLELLVFVLACSDRCGIHNRPNAAKALRKWLNKATKACSAEFPANAKSTAKAYETVLRGRGSKLFNAMSATNPLKPRLEIGWRSGHDHDKLAAQACIRYGNIVQTVGRGRSLGRAEMIEEAMEFVRDLGLDRIVGHLTIDRVDFFLTFDEIARPWQYCPCGSPMQVRRRLPWPSAIRLQEVIDATVCSPPDPFDSGSVACSLSCSGPLRDHATLCGGFVLHDNDDDRLGDHIRDVAGCAVFGLWNRGKLTDIQLQSMLDELDRVPYVDLPTKLHRLKLVNAVQWQGVGMLFDHPSWPRFEYPNECYEDDDHQFQTVRRLMSN